jgi:hypothetical protein
LFDGYSANDEAMLWRDFRVGGAIRIAQAAKNLSAARRPNERFYHADGAPHPRPMPTDCDRYRSAARMRDT